MGFEHCSYEKKMMKKTDKLHPSTSAIRSNTINVEVFFSPTWWLAGSPMLHPRFSGGNEIQQNSVDVGGSKALSYQTGQGKRNLEVFGVDWIWMRWKKLSELCLSKMRLLILCILFLAFILCCIYSPMKSCIECCICTVLRIELQATYVVGQVWTSIKCSAACTAVSLLLHMLMCGQ